MSADGGDALDDNVLIEEDPASDAEEEKDGEEAEIATIRARKHSMTERKAKGKKRRTEPSDAAEHQAADRNEEGDLPEEEVEPIEPKETPREGAHQKKRRHRDGGDDEDVRFADAEKQAAYLSRQLIKKDGSSASIESSQIVALSAKERTPDAIWSILTEEIPDVAVFASARSSLTSKKKKNQDKSGNESHQPAAAAAEQPAEEGCPAFVVLAASSQEGEELHKALSATVPSLARAFQRRQKIDSQIAFLKHSITGIVGLPPRLHKLADVGALSFTRCEYLIIDMSRNAKNFNFFEIKEVRESFAALFHSYLAPVLADGKMRIVLY